MTDDESVIFIPADFNSAREDAAVANEFSSRLPLTQLDIIDARVAAVWPTELPSDECKF